MAALEGGFKRRIMAGFAWEGLSRVFVQLVSWATTIVVARILHPEDYGIVALSGVFVGFLAIVTEWGLVQGLVNQKQVTRRQLDGVFWVALGVGAGSYGILYLIAWPLEAIYGHESLSAIVRVSGIGLLLASIKIVPVAIVLRELDFRYRAIVEMSGQMVSAVTVITLAVWGAGAWSLIVAVIAMQSVTTVAYLPKMGAIPGMNWSVREVTEVLSYGTKLMVARLLEFLTIDSPVFFLASLQGKASAGHYSMANQLASALMEKVGAIFNRIAFPALSAVKEDREACRVIFLKMHRYLVRLAYPILVGVILVAEPAVDVILTEKWRPIVPLLQAVAAVNLLRVSGMLMPYVLAGRGRAGAVVRYQVAAAIVLPCAFFFGAWAGGLKGVAAAWLIAYPPLYGYLLRLVIHELMLTYAAVIESMRSTAISCAAMALAIITFQSASALEGPLVQLLGSIAVGAISYVAVTIAWYREEWREIWLGITGLRARRSAA